jgi:hypothetical protein
MAIDMGAFLKKFLSRRGVWALLPALVIGLAQRGSAQNTVVSNYTSLLAALVSSTTITNFSNPSTIIMTAGAEPTFQITGNIKIDAGNNSVLFQGDGTERFFFVHSNAVLTLNNIELTNGGSTQGGAIYNAGTLVISNCVLTGNNATNSNGFTGSNGPPAGGNGTNGTPGGSAEGGAIYSIGPVFISFSILTNNTVQAGNGGSGGSGTVGFGNGGNGGNGTNGGNAFGGALYGAGSNFLYMTEFASNTCTAGNGGAGGSFASNLLAQTETGGEAGLGGTGAGGAVFAAGWLSMSNCLFFNNVAVSGGTGAAEVDSDGGGAEGSPGGSALGGGLFITNGAAGAVIENSIFFFNACASGAGGSTTLNNAYGGPGGAAEGGGVWSGAALTQIGFCTFATNFLTGGAGGTNIGGGTSGLRGITNGSDIFGSAGIVNLTGSILAGDGLAGMTNAAGVTDDGYNISSDGSPTKSTVILTTKLNTNPDLNSALTTVGGPNIGGSFGAQQMFTLTILSNSPAAGIVPGVPGSTFPATDEVLQDRGTPASAGAYELNPITFSTNVVLPTIISVSPTTNLTGAGATVTFTVTTTNGSNFGFQWQLDSTNIYDNTNYSGTASSTLTIKDANAGDEGPYTVLVSPTLLEGANSNSVPVYLILTNPPVIKTQITGMSRPVGSIVTFTLNVGPYPQAFGYQWMLNGADLPTNTEYSINYNVLTIDPLMLGDAGIYSVIVSNRFGSGFKTSVNARLTVVPDRVRPIVTITNSLANNLRTNSVLPIIGTASDNAQVSNVLYWFTNINAGVTNVMSGAAIVITNGSTNLNKTPNVKLWSITNTPLPGTNILAVLAVDYSSNLSTVVTRHFFYKVPSTLSLTNVPDGGFGSLAGHSFIHNDTAPTNGALLNIGEGYSIVATPNPGSLTGNWTNTFGTNVMVTNGNTLKFVMESNMVIYATFVRNPFQGIAGTYDGLFYVTNELVTTNVVTNSVINMVGGTNQTNMYPITNQAVTLEVSVETAGMLDNLVLGAEGAYSGRLLLAGGSYPLSGTFDSYGSITNLVKLPAALGGPLKVVMNVNTNGVGSITGTVSNALWTNAAYLTANLGVVASGAEPVQYTLLMLPSTNMLTNVVTNAASPPGAGYALITDRGGRVTLSGGLADGTTFSQSVLASQSNDVPVYVSLYEKTGFLFGWLNLTNMNSTNSTNGLIWIKGVPPHPSLLFPNGFTNLLLTEGSLWTKPDVITLGSSNTLTIVDSNGLDLNYTVAIDGDNKLVNPSGIPTNSLTGTINLTTGLMQVTFGNGDNRATTRGYGVMLQNTANAGGYFATRTNAGSIFLNGSGAPPLPEDVLIQYLQSPLTLQDQQYAEYLFTNVGPVLPTPQAVFIDAPP